MVRLPKGTSRHSRRASSLLADLLTRGKAGGYPADIKMIYSAAGDLFNQCPNANKTVAALDRVEFLVAQDHFLTPTARYADIVLPATTHERRLVGFLFSGRGHHALGARLQPPRRRAPRRPRSTPGARLRRATGRRASVARIGSRS